jgi:hypothetical protein
MPFKRISFVAAIEERCGPLPDLSSPGAWCGVQDISAIHVIDGLLGQSLP